MLHDHQSAVHPPKITKSSNPYKIKKPPTLPKEMSRSVPVIDASQALPPKSHIADTSNSTTRAKTEDSYTYVLPIPQCTPLTNSSISWGGMAGVCSGPAEPPKNWTDLGVPFLSINFVNPQNLQNPLDYNGMDSFVDTAITADLNTITTTAMHVEDYSQSIGGGDYGFCNDQSFQGGMDHQPMFSTNKASLPRQPTTQRFRSPTNRTTTSSSGLIYHNFACSCRQ